MWSTFKRGSAIGMIACFILLFSCQKAEMSDASETALDAASAKTTRGHLKQTKQYPVEILTDWSNVYLEMFRTGGLGLNGNRLLGYMSIAAYESVAEGMPDHQSLSGQLTGMPDMPAITPGNAINWGLSLNAAMAAFARGAFPNAGANESLIQSVESKWMDALAPSTYPDIVARSDEYGKEVAARIISWAPSDGIGINHGTYTPKPGVPYWQPTPPNFPAAAGPFWGRQRPFVTQGFENLTPPPPPAYSNQPGTEYYEEMKEVYDLSVAPLSDVQKEIGLYYRDGPGYPGGTHFLSVLKLAVQERGCTLDQAVRVYAKALMALRDAIIVCFASKYQWETERPIQFIRRELGSADWLPLFNNPPYPDYPSGTSTCAGAVAQVLEDEFGNDFSFVNTTYDYLGMPPQSYSSPDDMAQQVAASRVYAGIHYRLSCTRGVDLGRAAVINLNQHIRFLK